MCSVSAPKPQTVEVEKPVFVRNPFLDDLDNKARTADALRRGRSSLVIPGDTTGIGFAGRAGTTSGTGPQSTNGASSGGTLGGGRSGGMNRGRNRSNFEGGTGGGTRRTMPGGGTQIRD